MKISIVTTSYNQADFLHKNLNSIGTQLYKNYEHIIIDPGSEDGSRKIIEEYANSNKNVIKIFEPDSGQVDAINKGLALATGDVLTWLNSDDYYDNVNVLADVKKGFDEHKELSVLYGRGLRVDHNGRKLSEAFVHPNGTDFTKSLASSIGILQPSLFFKRCVYEKVGGLDDKYNLQLDYEYWIRIAKANFKFGKVNKIFSRATVHQDAKSTGQRKEQFNECLFLMEEQFGFIHDDWLKRYAEFYSTREDRKVSKNIQKDEETLTYESAVYKGLKKNVTKNSPNSKVIATAFDDKYFNQGLNLLASLHRTSFTSFDKVIVYPVGLTTRNIEILNALDKVELRYFPDSLNSVFEGFLEPKHRAYKSYVIDDMASGLEQGDFVLWMDAGLSCVDDVECVFEQISEYDFFMPDHDDKDSWPFYNINFTHPEAIKHFNATTEELLAPHLCSCLVGYKVKGKFQHLIDEAVGLGKIKDVVLWPKMPDDKFKANLSGNMNRKKLNLLKNPTSEKADYNELSQLFDYYGHRTQSIYSILASRYKAPSFSGKVYRMSNDISSNASIRNWKDSALDTRELSSKYNLEAVDSTVKIFHHRGVYNNLDGLRFKRNNNTLFILGNGPSLRDAPFEDIFSFDTIGMNAAYRFWDEKGLYPTYYCCMDTVVLESHKEEVRRLILDKGTNKIKHFFLRKCFLTWYPDLVNQSCITYLEDIVEQENSMFDMDKVTTGSYSLLWAIYLGYRRVNILGVDLDYVEKVDGAELKKGRILEISEDSNSNPNYFFDGYQVKGDKYNPPNPHPNLHVRSWHKVANCIAGFPIVVKNLNPNSLVKDFEFSTVTEFLKSEKKLGKQYEHVAYSSKQAIQEREYWRAKFLEDLEFFESQSTEYSSALRTLSKSINDNTLKTHYKIHSMYDDVFASGWHTPEKVKGVTGIFSIASKSAKLRLEIERKVVDNTIIVIKVAASFCNTMLETLNFTDQFGKDVKFTSSKCFKHTYLLIEPVRPTEGNVFEYYFNFSPITKINERDLGLKITGLYILPKVTYINKPFPYSHFNALAYADDNEEGVERVLNGKELSLLHDYISFKIEKDYITTKMPLSGYRFHLTPRKQSD